MPFNFPNNPNTGDMFAPVGGAVYRFNGEVWLQNAPTGDGTLAIIGDAPPADPLHGQLWWESDTGKLFIWYDDGTSAQWVESTVANPVDLDDQVVIAAGASTPRTLAAHFGDMVSVKDFGAIGDGVANDTLACQAAAASGLDIFVPTGRYVITDMISIPTGRTWRGVDRLRSVFWARNTFNLSALGIFRLVGPSGGSMFDIGIVCEQDQNVASRAACVHYPPAIYMQSNPRCVLDNIRIDAAWDGINAFGNTGGGYFGRLEIGALNKGIWFDGALDFVHGESWHFWVFGMSSGPIFDVYADGTTIACEFGRLDLLSLDKLGVYRSKVILNNTTAHLQANYIGVLQMDSNASRLVSQGVDDNWFIGVLTSSSGAAGTYGAFGPDIDINGGRVQISRAIFGGEAVGPRVKVAAGYCVIGGGHLGQTDVTQPFGLVTGGKLELRNSTIALPSSARTVPYIEQTGGTLNVKGCNVDTTAGSGPVIKVNTDSGSIPHDISNNSFNAFSLEIPTATTFGYYGPNKFTSMSTFVTTPSFNTMGDAVFTQTSQACRYRILGSTLWFEIYINFDLTWTTAAQHFILTGPPILPKTSTQLSPVYVEKAVFDSTKMYIADIGSTGLITIRILTSGSGVTSFGVANLPPNTGYIFRLSGEYRIRA